MGVSGFIKKEWWQTVPVSSVVGEEDTVAEDWLATNFNLHRKVEWFARQFQRTIDCTEENAVHLGQLCY